MRKNTDSNNIIIFKDVTKIYEGETKPALDDITFSIKSGEFVCIIGPSGCGKSTLLKIIAGLEKESYGTVIKPENIAMVFQGGTLFPWLSVFENVALVLRAKKLKEKEVYDESMKYIEMMGLKNYFLKYPRDLSGGQRQRVGIARALAVNPAVLLLDEPFSALDAKTTEELHNDIINIWRETKKTIVMVSHLIEEAVSLSDRIILMRNSTIEHFFRISLRRPRRDQEEKFTQEVLKIRKEFFK